MRARQVLPSDRPGRRGRRGAARAPLRQREQQGRREVVRDGGRRRVRGRSGASGAPQAGKVFLEGLRAGFGRMEGNRPAGMRAGAGRRTMKVGARNRIVGKVTEIKKDSVMCQVKVEIPASAMSSVMTTESLEEMGLKKGDSVQVVVKGVNVLLIKE